VGEIVPVTVIDGQPIGDGRIWSGHHAHRAGVRRLDEAHIEPINRSINQKSPHVPVGPLLAAPWAGSR
jgi:hypothetical protein